MPLLPVGTPTPTQPSLSRVMQIPDFDKSSETVIRGTVTASELRGLPGKLAGCVYREDGTKVTLSERLGGVMGDYVISDNPEVVTPVNGLKALHGRGLYLGHYMGGHYGHFITETLSTFWIFEETPASAFDYFLFHPFVFGLQIPAYVRFCLDRFEIPVEKIAFVGSEALTFEELLVPERLFRLNHSADPRSRWTYQHLSRETRAPFPASSRLYLSRRRFSRTNFERVVANEVEMEREFLRRGFRVLYPETMGFEDQIALYSRADCMAGISGSGLHNSIFMRPQATVIELGDARYGGLPAPSQALCNKVSGVKPEFIPFVGGRFGARRTMLFDMPFLRRSLDRIAEAAPGSEHPIRVRTSLLRRLVDALEVAYLSVRPSLGFVARRILERVRFRRTHSRRV